MSAISILTPARFAALACAIAAFSGSTSAQEAARPPVELVRLQGNVVHLHRPAASQPAPHVAVIYQNGAQPGPAQCAAMAQRGFLALCVAESGSIEDESWEAVALDMKRAIEFARRLPGIERVVLYGHSGGGSVSSFYQAVAENGVAYCQDPRKLSRCGNDLANLPRADAIVFPDAHPGTAIMNVRNLNPAISLRDGRIIVDPALDPTNPANGYAPDGKARYPAAFRQRYYAAQAAAMDALIAEGRARQARIERGDTVDPRDAQILVPGLMRPGRLEAFDPTIEALMQTRGPRKLLRNDASVVVQQIRSAFVGEAPGGGPTALQNLARFLSRSATRGAGAQGLDECSSNSNTICNVGFIRAPVLFMPMGGYIFIADQERMFEVSPSPDKDFVVTEGALHSGAACTRCETTPGQFANSQRNTYDYIANWIRARFPKGGR